MSVDNAFLVLNDLAPAMRCNSTRCKTLCLTDGKERSHGNMNPFQACIQYIIHLHFSYTARNLYLPEQHYSRGMESGCSSRSYSIRRNGPANTPEHAVYMQDENDSPISAIHDVALFARRDRSVLRMVVTAPRWTNARMKVCAFQRVASKQPDSANSLFRLGWTKR